MERRASVARLQNAQGIIYADKERIYKILLRAPREQDRQALRPAKDGRPLGLYVVEDPAGYKY
eukprot:scaffold11021_cov37-Prasinocladus_malaysianus.AAC.1